jgi:hypothetical protein
MSTRINLQALSEREFRREYKAPTPVLPARRFKPINVNLGKLNESWDRKRGSAARMMAVVLRDGDMALAERVSASSETSRAYAEAARWLRR